MAQVKEGALILVLSAIVLTNLYDLFLDYSHNASLWHLFEESLVVVVSATAIFWLLRHTMQQQRELADLKRELQAGTGSADVQDPLVREARHRMSEVIQQQFRQWALTASEQQVALLLLKGLSFKEIAAVRNTLEKTVRQQASGIYKKADVTGRHAFSAWFIEDFLE
jgi:DNA-binding NarL/FixJ family response regulator